MTYKFLSGNRQYLNEKQWQFQLKSSSKKLHDYMRTGMLDNNNKNYDGYLDVYEYHSASEILGCSSLIEFYLSQKESLNELEKLHVDNFFLAAHYAAKIGQKQRTVHWLLMASRTYCRLKKRDGQSAYRDSRINFKRSCKN